MKKVANRGKGGVATTLWMDHWFVSCSYLKLQLPEHIFTKFPSSSVKVIHKK